MRKILVELDAEELEWLVDGHRTAEASLAEDRDYEGSLLRRDRAQELEMIRRGIL